jgi:mRNA-degrading endonuclease RelE of RelBE toxin-antitoxin system
MVKSWQKKLDCLDCKLAKVLSIIVEDIIKLNLSMYYVEKLEWYSNLFRIRKWKIRIIFSKTIDKWIIEKIDFRWDIYKWL